MFDFDATPTFCTLCLNKIKGDSQILDASAKAIFGLVLSKLSGLEETNYVCNACYEKIFSASQFKSTCLYNEANINLYTKSETTPTDIKKVYLKKITDELDEQEICRFCLKPVSSEFTKLRSLEKAVISKYIPEVNLNSIKNPIVCKQCFESFQGYVKFIYNFEQKNRVTVQNVQVSLSPSPCDAQIKIEEGTIKLETNEEQQDEALVDLKFEVYDDGKGSDSKLGSIKELKKRKKKLNLSAKRLNRRIAQKRSIARRKQLMELQKKQSCSAELP